ncbi:restriction endonuclease subunit S [Neobacillus piezotolerans]|uniref:Restriction endonuclease subunit S n=1 Tax=Neobacillus piezotolerans TaxID=2259171 RepID=A0A3D8GWV5_9BACI|nr:restriction endonuclease subunit S [Neobacillus piezotolerans]RDU38924.1 restriction endonuclease subunit S [Neobacillus piezotolerans]
MDLVAISELCQINIGRTPSRSNSSYWGKGHKWLSISDMKSKFVKETKEEITDLAITEAKMKVVPKNTVLMSFKLSIGKVAITQEEIYTNEAIASFPILKKDKLTPQYLYYALKTLSLDSLTDRAVMGATLNKAKLNQLKIPLPPIAEQNRIVGILEKAEIIIGNRIEQLEELIDLAKSLFYEMFGNPSINSKGFILKPLNETCINVDDIRCGPFGTQLSSKEFVKTGVPLWGIKHINSKFKISTDEYVTPEKALFLENYSLIPGDIVMTRKGTVGKCAIYPEHLPGGIMHSDLLRIRVNQEILNPTFLMFQFSLSKDVEHQLSQISSGAIMKGLNVTKLKKVRVLVPPIELQNEFADKISQIEQLRNTIQESLTILEENYKSLLQLVLNGELFFN